MKESVCQDQLQFLKFHKNHHHLYWTVLSAYLSTHTGKAQFTDLGCSQWHRDICLYTSDEKFSLLSKHCKCTLWHSHRPYFLCTPNFWCTFYTGGLAEASACEKKKKKRSHLDMSRTNWKGDTPTHTPSLRKINLCKIWQVSCECQIPVRMDPFPPLKDSVDLKFWVRLKWNGICKRFLAWQNLLFLFCLWRSYSPSLWTCQALAKLATCKK